MRVLKGPQHPPGSSPVPLWDRIPRAPGANGAGAGAGLVLGGLGRGSPAPEGNATRTPTLSPLRRVTRGGRSLGGTHGTQRMGGVAGTPRGPLRGRRERSQGVPGVFPGCSLVASSAPMWGHNPIQGPSQRPVISVAFCHILGGSLLHSRWGILSPQPQKIRRLLETLKPVESPGLVSLLGEG